MSSLFARPVAAPVIRLDPEGRLDDDLLCRGCAYNLKTLRPDAICPECGMPVARSVHGDSLRFCNPHWVRRLVIGIKWIIGGLVLNIAVMCIGRSVLPRAGIIPRGIPVALTLFGPAVALVGYWMVTIRDPGRPPEESWLCARQFVRIGKLAGLVVSAVLLLVAMQTASASAVALADLFIEMVAAIALFKHLHNLALRVPNDWLAGRTTLVMRGFCTGLAAMGAIRVLQRMGIRPTRGGGLGARDVFLLGGTCVGLFGTVVFGVWYVKLLLRFHRTLDDAALQAAQSWSNCPNNPSPTEVACDSDNAPPDSTAIDTEVEQPNGGDHVDTL